MPLSFLPCHLTSNFYYILPTYVQQGGPSQQITAAYKAGNPGKWIWNNYLTSYPNLTPYHRDISLERVMYNISAVVHLWASGGTPILQYYTKKGGEDVQTLVSLPANAFSNTKILALSFSFHNGIKNLIHVFSHVLCRLPLCLNGREHSLISKRFPPVWILMWVCKWIDCVNEREHSEHL
jgi:hypothetical protein